MNSIDRAFIDDLLSRIDIVEIIGEVVKLKKMGANHKGLCPFHSEKTPSFNVSSTKQFYHCFGCGASGDAIKFLREHYGLSFMEAIEKLASIANVEIPKNNQTVHIDTKFYDVNKVTLEFFKKSLNENKKARTYLHSRGFDEDMIEKFDIGYAEKSWDKLKNYLIAKKMINEGIELGLIVKNEDKIYDRFRERIMFPIKNNSGKVIAFGGRTLDKNEKAKYINSPESKLFFKSAEMYGLYEAKQEIYKKESVIIVEGYTDVVSLHKNGYANTIATLGTALTKFHVRKIKRFTNEIIFCFDGDIAGKNAANKAMFNVLPELTDGLDINFCFLDKGKDPDEICREDRNLFNTYLSNSMKLSEYMIQSAKKDFDIQKIEDKVKFINNIKSMSDKLPEGIFKKLFIDEIKKLSNINITDIAKNPNTEIHTTTTQDQTSELNKVDSIILSTLFKFPELINELPDNFKDIVSSDVVKNMIQLFPKFKNDKGYVLNKFLEEEEEIKNIFIKYSTVDVFDNTKDEAIKTITSIIDNEEHIKRDTRYNNILKKYTEGEELTSEEKNILKNYKK